jgi:hypothetical protein
MGARTKLNSAYVTGSLVVAGLVGWVLHSWVAFLVAAAVLVVLALLPMDHSKPANASEKKW